ncbi:hypothetical protein [Acinetobacter sp. YT-02]|uniref:hypothetical protein n=1 Tax=Acinetobacter sp. YT-02 TaxID=2018564 RepID=UPI000BCA0109|nr:hypothetical protein [Acinetobacter sp. YT-02]PCN59355.1 hypothetical protein CF596_13560 [Acinetobacter sp. YT-02]|eukprot:TRINITY_DN992_c1_g3_i1.p1 TRINITY_DN992_c1_g3~~TRINITY_DN992_c1_g3_i1.p1  ORF type:complete len:317 (+),score=14.44 TRINITY_DN992_c1_g3_i1:100-1050(+)
MLKPAFSSDEFVRMKLVLATKVVGMMGRKLEEDDWTDAYCQAKNIPRSNWSNLNIDINYQGLGVEIKLYRVKSSHKESIKENCGTTKMHPAATRSIRIDSSLSAEDAKNSVLKQYAELIIDRTNKVKDASNRQVADMRSAWVLWEPELREFLYFEEEMFIPNPQNYFAEWNITKARGSRKESKSLWIYDKKTKLKRYSVTTDAGAKIQPYFDIPAASDPNLYYFRVQSEMLSDSDIGLWVSQLTAQRLEKLVDIHDKQKLSEFLLTSIKDFAVDNTSVEPEYAVCLTVNNDAYEALITTLQGVSDEHNMQLFLKYL